VPVAGCPKLWQQRLGYPPDAEHVQAEDEANAIVYVVAQPEKVSTNHILTRSSQQPN
jgi:NADP-dependent 3-hydroxy acid dehydrogenase YdfG